MNNILNIINEEINNLNEFAANPLNQKRLNYLKYQIKKNNPDLIVEALRWGGETTYWLIDKKDNNSITYFENNFKTPIGYYEEEDFKKIVDYFTTTAKKYITIKRNFNILKHFNIRAYILIDPIFYFMVLLIINPLPDYLSFLLFWLQHLPLHHPIF